MRTLKSLLVCLIGLTALMYAVQNLGDIDAMRGQIRVFSSTVLKAARSKGNPEDRAATAPFDGAAL